MPMRVLYAISDGLYVLIFKLIKYRKKVVFENLTRSFPQKSSQEIEQIAIDFYRFFCDFLVENIKSITISKKQISERITFIDSKDSDFYAANNQSVIGVLGHFGNWEWVAQATTIFKPFHLNVIYKELSNKHFDWLMKNTRSKFGSNLIESKNVAQEMYKNRHKLCATIFVADQSPQPQNAIWLTFLNQETAVFRGTAIIAQKFNLPIIYTSIHRTKRGYYHVVAKTIVSKPKEKTETEILTIFMQHLEEDIKKNPQFWLWTHRRWKHKKPVNA